MPSSNAFTLATELRAVVGQIKRWMQQQSSFGDLTASQVAVLARLERDGAATATALAHAEGMRPQSMGAIVAALQAAGLVEGAPDPRDGRQTLLSLTPVCRETIDAGRLARQDRLHRAIEARLTPAEQADLLKAVALLRRLIEP